jgi:Na+/proline symporter
MAGLDPIDIIIIVIYFCIVAYLGLFLGRRKTKTLGDFLIAGGSWGSLVAFLFNFSSALAGAEAVVVSAAAYVSGLSGIWYWWSMLFATPVYFLFSVIFKRARVFNTAEFFDLRFGGGVATLYALLGVLVCMNFIGIFELGAGKVVAAITGISVDSAILLCCTLVALYVASGGAMSSLLTDLFQGVLCLVLLSFGFLPFLWTAAGGWNAVQGLPPEIWSLQSVEIPWTYIVALLFSGAVGSVVAPNILTWIAIGRDEKAGTQCGWAHLWKRIVTVFFALYGILFALYWPGLEDPELAWGTVMKAVLPAGVLGLLVASFAAALMSSVDTFATTTSGLVVDHLYRKRFLPGRSLRFYVSNARLWGFIAVFLGYLTTRFLTTIVEYIELSWSLISFISVPLYFGLVWRRTNRQALWAALAVSSTVYCFLRFWMHAPFEWTVFIPTVICAFVTWAVSLVTAPEDETLLNRFYCVLSTPIGQDSRLIQAGISLPALKTESDTTLPEMDPDKIRELYQSYAGDKLFGRDSSIEVRWEEGLRWYYRGFVVISLSCFGLMAFVFLVSKWLQWQ